MNEAGFTSPLIAICVFTLVFAIGFGASLLLKYLRRHQKPPSSLPSRSRLAAPVGTKPVQETVGATSGTDTSPMPAVVIPNISEMLVASAVLGTRVCPTCSRRFDESLALCPYDATPLRAQDRGQWVVNRDETPRPTCHECGRRYDKGANYCRSDGSELSQGLVAGRLPIVYVCACCGDETLTDESCGCAAPDRKTIDASNTKVITPSLPLMICPLCHSNGGFGAVLCPNDGALLRPLFNLNINVLAPSGRGPRRKMCPECGTPHSGSATFCMKDGHRLDSLN